MALVTETGATVDVEAASLEFDRALSNAPQNDEPIAPAPPKVEKKEPAKTEAKPAAKRTRKPTNTKTIPAPASPALTQKRIQAGADIMHSLAVVTETFHVATGEEAWHKDTELFAAVAPQFGQAMADVAAHNPAFARYLDSEGTGAAAAYFGLAVVSLNIGMAVVDNHNARGKVALLFQGIGLKAKSFLSRTGKGRKHNARGMDSKTAVR